MNILSVGLPKLSTTKPHPEIWTRFKLPHGIFLQIRTREIKKEKSKVKFNRNVPYERPDFEVSNKVYVKESQK